MARLVATLRRHPLTVYFTLAYAISWGGVVAMVGIGGLGSGNLEMPRGMVVWAAMLAGPSIAGILITYLVSGRTGLRDVWRRLCRWRVPRRWYATLLLTPVICSAIVAGLSLVSESFRPWLSVEPNQLLVLGTFFALAAGAWVEELGWTGFATPRLRMIHTPPAASAAQLLLLWTLFTAVFVAVVVGTSIASHSARWMPTPSDRTFS
jgi:hypothetical protein